MRRPPARLARLAVGVALLGGARPALAKPPTLTALEPAGVRQGGATRVVATGSFDRWPISAWTDDPGLVVTADAEKGRLWVEAGPRVTPGLHWLRLHDEEGATALRPFLVGTLPEATEVEPNDAPSRPQPIDRDAVTINGKLAQNNDIDGFGVRLRKGEVLVASVEANRLLGSPMDGLLQVARPDGIVLAENDDDQDRDPRLAFEAPADGDYIVRVFAFPATPDSRIGYSGGPNYIYRLTLTTRAFVDHAYPMALSRAAIGPVAVSGWNLGEARKTMGPLPADAGAFATVADTTLGNVALVRLVEHPTDVEREPNPPDAPQSITTPISITGKIDEGRDTDAFRFEAKKGERLLVQVESRRLGQPLDPAFRILDAAGKIVAESDDASRNQLDAESVFNPPADGAYRVVVRDVNRQGGPRAAYLLTIAPPKPDFRLTLDADRVTLSHGKPATMTIKVERTNGFDGEIEIAAEGLPEGVTAKPMISESKGDSSKTVKLAFEADAVVGPLGSGPFRVVGRIKGSDEQGKAAEAKIEGYEGNTAWCWLTVATPEPSK